MGARPGFNLRLAPLLMLGGLLLLALSPALLDAPMLNWARQKASSGILAWWGQLAYVAGLASVQYIGLGLAALFCWFSWRRGLVYTLLIAGASVTASGLATQVIKHLVGRPRPRLGMDTSWLAGPTWVSDWHSFPSGHTSTSVALACVLAAKFPDKAWLFYGLAALVGVGRVLSGSHYVSDVMAGALLGLAVGLPMSLLLGHRREQGV